MVLQAIRELSDKMDKNHKEVTERLDRLEEKVNYIQHKIVEHDQDIYTLKRKAL